MCLPIVFQQCDFDFAGNWHVEAVEEYDEEEGIGRGTYARYLMFDLDIFLSFTSKL